MLCAFKVQQSCHARLGEDSYQNMPPSAYLACSPADVDAACSTHATAEMHMQKRYCMPMRNGTTDLASSCKALQPGDLEEGDDGEHDGSQCIDGQPVLLHHIHFIECQLSEQSAG